MSTFGGPMSGRAARTRTMLLSFVAGVALLGPGVPAVDAASNAGALGGRGAVDRSFGNNGTTLQRGDAAFGAAQDAQGRVLTVSSGAHGNAVSRYLTSGALDTTFGNHGFTDVDESSYDVSLTGIAVSPDGGILVLESKGSPVMMRVVR